MMEEPSRTKVSEMNEGDPLEGRYLPADAPSAVFRSQMALQEAQRMCLANFGELVKCRECGSDNDLHGKDKSLYDENSELVLYCDNSACELTGTMPSLGRAWKSSLERGYEDLDNKTRLLWDQLSHVDALQIEYNIALKVMNATEESRKGPSPCSSLASAVSITNNLQMDGLKNANNTEQWGDMDTEVENLYCNNSKKRDRPASTPDPSPVVRKVAPSFRESSPTTVKSPNNRTSIGNSQPSSSGYRNPFKKLETPIKPLNAKSPTTKSPLPAAPTSVATNLKDPTLMGPPATPQSKPPQSEVAALRAENILLKQEMAILRDQITALQKTMDKLVAKDQRSGHKKTAEEHRGTTRGRGGYRGGRGSSRMVTRQYKDGRETSFYINEDSDSDASHHEAYSLPEDCPEEWRLQRGPNYDLKKKAKEAAQKSGMDINKGEGVAPGEIPNTTVPPTYADKAKAPPPRPNVKKQRERDLALSFFRPVVPQEWKLAKILWNPSKTVKRSEDKLLMNKLAWRAMEKLEIRPLIREISLVGKSMLVLYYCEAVATQVEEALAKAKIPIINGNIPTAPALGTAVNIKEKTINRISYLCAKHHGLTKLVKLFTDELPPEWREACQLKTAERMAAAPATTTTKDRNRVNTNSMHHNDQL